MYKDWFKRLTGFDLILSLLVIGLSYQMIGFVHEEKWVYVTISAVFILVLIVLMVLGYRKKLTENCDVNQQMKNSQPNS